MDSSYGEDEGFMGIYKPFCKIGLPARRDVGIAPYAEFWIERNSHPLCVGRAHLSPPLLAPSVLLQAISNTRCGAGDSFSHGLRPCQLPQRGSQGAAAGMRQ